METHLVHGCLYDFQGNNLSVVKTPQRNPRINNDHLFLISDTKAKGCCLRNRTTLRFVFFTRLWSVRKPVLF